MQVMNSTEFESTDVLVGGTGKTGKFTVNDDPHLMSMLSTSLYANPLRTMIQEIMFNAWDAHRMGNCQDRPIDIYLNDTTGLIVRDYGPGIDPAMIDDIYCTYGASTKRDDSNQTGGFGLGSKSPYAYNDNFMVANHHNGTKNMYIMRRVHDDNDGGPGYDHVIQNVPTTESGLMVTVPFKTENDRRRAYKYLKDLLFLSGVKANIYYEGSDEEVERVDEKTLLPGEFTQSSQSSHGLWAVYGGVKYTIPEHEEYAKEYKFLYGLNRKMGGIYIGFAPNTLTPLPNREGLNMRERSIESIKSQLETLYEHFMSQIIPATKATLIEVFRSMKSSGLQHQFLYYKWKKVGEYDALNDLVFDYDDVISKIMDRCSNETHKNLWRSIVEIGLNQTNFFQDVVGYDKFFSLKGLIWAKELPKYKHWRFHIAPTGGLKKKKSPLSEHHTQYAKWLISTQRKIEEITGTEQKPRVKVGDAHNWFILTNQRKAGKTDHIRGAKQKEIVLKLSRARKLKIPERLYDDVLWFQKDGNRFVDTMKQGSVIVAKTAAALSETRFEFQKIMVPRHPKTYGYDKWHWGQWVDRSSVRPVAAFVVHKRKGNYDKVVKMLQSEGIEVIEADEPEVKVRTKLVDDADSLETPKGPPPMYVVDPYRDNWEGSEEVKKPSTYLYATQTYLNGYHNGYHADFVSLVMKYAPKMVIIHNKVKAAKLSKQGAFSFEERVKLIVEKLLSDPDRIKTLALHGLVHQESGLPKQIIAIPEMQKLMGLPYLRTKQAEIFDRDREFLQKIYDPVAKRRSYYGYRVSKGISGTVVKKVTEAFEQALLDPSVVQVRQMIKATKAFDTDALATICEGMKPGERKVLAQKIARFLRTF